MAASIGTLGQLGIGDADPVTQRLNYVTEDFTRKDEVIDGNGIRGTRSQDSELVMDGIQRINGPVNLIPTALEMSYLLQWIMGGTPTGTGTVTYPLADTIQTKYLTVDRRQKVFTYAGVGVNMATFRASRGTPLSVELGLIGQTESVGNSGTFPVLTLDVSTKPFVFHNLVLSVESTTVSCAEFMLSVNNMIDADRFFNSQTLTAVNALDREIRFGTSLPYGDYEAIRAAMNAGAGGLSVVATFTVGNTALAFSLPAVAVPMRAPGTPGRVEIMLPVEGRAYRLAGARELVTTLDSTP